MGYYDFLVSPTLPKGRRPQDTGQPIKLFKRAEELPLSWGTMSPEQQQLWRELGRMKYTMGAPGVGGTFAPAKLDCVAASGSSARASGGSSSALLKSLMDWPVSCGRLPFGSVGDMRKS